MKKKFAGILLALTIMSAGVGLNPARIFASEGTIELKNQVGEAARCFGLSVLMQNRSYDVLVSCRDILYPGGTDVFSYVVWANRIDGSRVDRLGTLGLGKVRFATKYAFSSVFVTKEFSSNPRQPEGVVVMRGSVQRIPLLEQASAASTDDIPNELDEASQEEPVEETQTSSRTGLFRMIAAGGILGFLALFAVILVIFVITRR